MRIMRKSPTIWESIDRIVCIEYLQCNLQSLREI
jgi:hypothetical protein